ncbi:phthiocerol/phthiodiolone dimycocerosyl transferase family protein [Amycolatopsis alkalitolerans]|uniref:Phthiocerol/phthiodiolone dimycocerosyl transferase n=1 Tax=Amycolatopsis alkalitolerans TaxID=2547244 RepID=A0A5C4LS90_9PSEU|nr:condensation domain-containing protein [Amycolatopsis alkalitolerans]TNC19276.1 hypothetical protein FG385_32675 [Amycolatopsis alkalitolerans]
MNEAKKNGTFKENPLEAEYGTAATVYHGPMHPLHSSVAQPKWAPHNHERHGRAALERVSVRRSLPRRDRNLQRESTTTRHHPPPHPRACHPMERVPTRRHRQFRRNPSHLGVAAKKGSLMASIEDTPKMERYLDFQEAPKLYRNSTMFVEYQGSVDGSVLARAYSALCDRHPVLRARIRFDEWGDLLYVTPDHGPEFVVCQGNAETLRSMALAEDWDPADHVAQLTLIRRATGGFVAMRTTNAIADGVTKFALMREMWDLYTSILHGRTIPPVTTASFPRSPVELLRERSSLDPRSADRYESTHRSKERMTPVREPSASQLSDCTTRRITLSEEDTAKLVVAAHVHNSTMYGLLSGVCVLAHSQGQATDESPTTVLTPVNLRPRVSPPIAPTETTMMTGLFTATVSVEVNSTAGTIGREIRSQLDSWTSAQRFSFPLRNDVISAATRVIQINNIGLKPSYHLPDELHIADHFVIAPYNDEKIDPGLLSRYHIMTYDQRLTIQCGYPTAQFSESDINRLIERIVDSVIGLISAS